MSEITVDVARALVAENERLFKLLERMVDQMLPLEEIKELPGYSRVLTAETLKAERDVLKAENESLRKAVAWAIQVHRDPELEHEIRNEEWLEDLEAAISSPENPY